MITGTVRGGELYTLYIVQEMSARAVAELMGFSHTRIRKLMDDADIPRRTQSEAVRLGLTGEPMPPEMEDREELERLLAETGSIKRLAKELGVGKSTLERALGRRETAAPRWLRAAARERDNHQCVICGEFAGDRALDTHHINFDSGDHRLENLATLCVRCHAGVHKTGYIVVLPTPDDQEEKEISEEEHDD